MDDWDANVLFYFHEDQFTTLPKQHHPFKKKRMRVITKPTHFALREVLALFRRDFLK